MNRTENGQATSLESVRAVVDRLRARHAEIARAIYDRIGEAVPHSVGARDLTYQEGVLAAVNAVLSYSLDVIEQGPGWSGPIPPEAAAQARRAARAGVSAAAVLRRYVAGHGRLGEFVAEETARIGLPSDAPALLHISSTHDALLGHFTAAIEHEHDQERQRIARSPEQRRVELVCRLLDGETVGQAGLADLGYKFDAWHVGVIATGASAREAVGSLKSDRQLLSVPQGEETVWAWLGGQRRLARADMERLCLEREPVGVSLAVGEPAQGLDGWRRTHQQAQEALQVALLGRQKRARYADIAVLTPFVQNLDRGRAFIELYLSPLDRQKDGGATSRQVLRAYFAAARNVSAAARKLGLERRTLGYRLETIAECLGYQLNGRLAELEVALRLHDLLEGDECTNRKKSVPQISTLP
jgi:PucR C-terminal helix-turn-helix domain/GGDEF-like domain